MMDVRMNEQMNEQTNEQTNKQTNGWTDGWMERWMIERIDGQIDVHSFLSPRCETHPKMKEKKTGDFEFESRDENWILKL